jgi:GntR family transcriptional repressor for pyruvate dehydrogenase complex
MFESLEKRKTVPEQVAGILQRAILRGELGVGERLPSENSLAEEFSTNRVSLRQALQLLKASGLIEGGQGRPWRVADYRHHGGVSLLPALLEAQGLTEETLPIVRDFFVLRTPLLVSIVEMACLRQDRAGLASMSEVLRELELAVEEGRASEELLALDIAWFEALIAAARSTLIRWFSDPMLELYKRSVVSLSSLWSPAEGYPGALREVQEAIEAGEMESACEVMRLYMEAERARWEGLLALLD